MDLIKRGGDAHGHVHDCAQRAYDYARHQEAFEPDVGARLPKLKQGLHVGDPETVDLGERLSQEPEDHGHRGAGQSAQEGAQGFAVDAAQYRKAYEGNVGAHQEGGQYGGSSLEEHGNQYQE